MRRHLNHRHVLMILTLLLSFLANQGHAQGALNDIELQEGESLMLPIQQVGRIAVGNGRVLNAAVADQNQVLLFAKSAGLSSLLIWQNDGSYQKLLVQVVSEESKRSHYELLNFLKRIPSVRAEIVGQQLIIQGENISEQDRLRIALLSKRYPNIIDFTNQLGWEKMITLEVQLIELPKHAMQELGVRWDTTSEGGINLGGGWDIGASSSVLTRPGNSPVDTHFPDLSPSGYLGLNALFSAKLSAMLKRGEATMLASPRLSARSGSSASFKAGGEIPYASVDKNGVSNTIFKPYGVSLEITPWVDEQGMIRSLIQVEVSSVDPSVTTSAGPALKTRSTQTEFNLRAEDTMVLSGFLARDTSLEVDGVPGISEIPLLGRLFRSERIQSVETELMILVTPRVDVPQPPMTQRAQTYIEQHTNQDLELFPRSSDHPFEIQESLWLK